MEKPSGKLLSVVKQCDWCEDQILDVMYDARIPKLLLESRLYAGNGTRAAIYAAARRQLDQGGRMICGTETT